MHAEAISVVSFKARAANKMVARGGGEGGADFAQALLLQGLPVFKARTVIEAQLTTRDFIRGEIRR